MGQIYEDGNRILYKADKCSDGKLRILSRYKNYPTWGWDWNASTFKSLYEAQEALDRFAEKKDWKKLETQ